MATYRILIIDDQPLVLTAIARFLEQRGYEVHTAANGEEGLAAAESVHPDLIITDVKMPIMDGWTLVKTLRSRPAFAVLPLIILTDQDSAESRMQGFRLGADDFVSKGTIVEEFLAPYDLIPFERTAAQKYAEIRHDLEKKGTPIGPNDLVIAATARARNLVLITHNTNEFGRVADLSIEDWTT